MAQARALVNQLSIEQPCTHIIMYVRIRTHHTCRVALTTLAMSLASNRGFRKSRPPEI